MSYNVDSFKVLRCDAWMLAADVAELLAKYEGDLPSNCFLYDVANRGPDEDGRMAIRADKFRWTGVWSGNSWPVLIEHVAPKIHGTIEAVVTWAGGDSFGGLRIVDGKVTEPEVIQTLAVEDEEPWVSAMSEAERADARAIIDSPNSRMGLADRLLNALELAEAEIARLRGGK